MTARRRLVPNSEIRRVLALAEDMGLPIGAVDIRTDGVTIHPPAAQQPAAEQGSAYDRWKAIEQKLDANRARHPRH